MKAVIQRVKSASVEIEHRVHTRLTARQARINRGMVILIGIEKGDEFSRAEALARKMAHLRIFEDDQHKMNLTISWFVE